MALFASIVIGTGTVLATSPDGETDSSDQHVVTIYDQGEKRVVLTRAQSVEATLAQAGISLAEHDRVEPGLRTEYEAQNYTVNIYRAHPVTIIDGMKREQVLTPRTTASDIVKDANIKVQQEDKLTLEQSTDLLTDGLGVRLTIERATSVNLILYGVPSRIYTQANTVEELFQERGLTLAASDTVTPAKESPIVEGTTIEVWRDGLQTANVEEEIDFPVRQVMATDRPVGFREVQTPGEKGKKRVVYEVVREGGREVSRKVIQELVVSEPKEQVELVGNKGANPLTKSKGAHHFVDSKGVSHRETYYDLPMNVVMGACGGGGYTVREDGAKVDAGGYILIAANLGNYPRCSIVETSMGLGRVYDTGGFAVKHPHGFDLATDWTKADGI